MITHASITVARDGAVLVCLPRSGMDLWAETVLSVSGRAVELRQGRRVYAAFEVHDGAALNALATAPDVTIAEVDDAGFDLHARVRRE